MQAPIDPGYGESLLDANRGRGDLFEHDGTPREPLRPRLFLISAIILVPLFGILLQLISTALILGSPIVVWAIYRSHRAKWNSWNATHPSLPATSSAEGSSHA